MRIFRVTRVGRDRLAGILRANRLKVRWPKRYAPQTTYSGHSYAVRENLLREYQVTAAGQVLVADITYIPLQSGHAYLFLITDAYSRMIVGHHLSDSLSHEGAVKALKSALKHMPNPTGVIHHSDRGVQYCCHDFIDQIQKWELKASMTDRDHCAQNALAERMNGILKREFLLQLRQSSLRSAKSAVSTAVQSYNYFRTHGSLEEKTPGEVHYGCTILEKLWEKELMPMHRLEIPDALRV